MSEISIALMSDLHCHPRGFQPQGSYLYNDAPAIPIKRHPIESLLDLIKKEGLSADALMVPGDLTHRCDAAGFGAAWDFAGRVRTALNAKIFVGTIGNHDVNSRGKVPDPFEMARTWRRDFPVANPDQQTKFWGDRFCMVEDTHLQILIVNSVSQHNSEAEVERGNITSQDLEKLEAFLQSKSIDNKIRVAMFHHHPIQHEDHGLGSEDLMVNGGLLVQILERYHFHIAVHGHKHHARLSYAPGGNQSLTVFCCGSFSGTGSGGIATNTRNLFHILTFRPGRMSTGGSFGVIRSWEFNMESGWNVPTRQSAGFPAFTGFGYRDCPRNLASNAADWFKCQNQTSVMNWGDLVAQFPMIEYLTPQNFEIFKGAIKDTDVFLSYDDLGRPERIGKP